MYQFGKDEAILLVRKNLDEQGVNDSYIIDLDDVDSDELDSILVKNLPEAINAVHSACPVQLLDGEVLSGSDLNEVSIDVNGVLSFSISKEMLRLVAFRAEDSVYVITKPVAEDSFEGRMQLNPYTQGTPDCPRLVLMQGKEQAGKSSFRYYSLGRFYSTPVQAIARFEYIPRYSYREGVSSYDVAENVVENVIDYLTGMMLVTYGNATGASYYFQKSGVSNNNEQPAE